MGIFSLPGLGQNYTFFGVNPSTGFADTFYKAQANKRANDAAYAAKKKDEGMDDYLKNVYLKNTNILPIYADKVKGEVAGWIASTNELKSKYGTGYQNSTPFVTSYMDLITKLNNYQQSSKAISDNLNDANKNPDKFVFKQDYNDALQKNDFNRLAELTGNPNAIYNNGMALDPAYDHVKTLNKINSVYKNQEVDIQNRKPLGNGIMSYEEVIKSNKNSPEYETLLRQFFVNDPASQAYYNGDANKFVDAIKASNQGDVAREKQMNIAKNTPAPSGNGYFNNSKVSITEGEGGRIEFKTNFEAPQDVVSRLKSANDNGTLETDAAYIKLINQGYSPSDLNAIATGKSTTLPGKTVSWEISKYYPLSFNQGDSKEQNFQTLKNGVIINSDTGEKEKDRKDVTGTIQSIIERKNEKGGKEYYAVIKTQNVTKGGEVIEGKTKYVLYDKNVAAQIEGTTTDPKTKSSFNLYKDGTIGGNTGSVTKIKVSSEDQSALEWVKSNPTDPRANKIKEKLKAKGVL